MSYRKALTKQARQDFQIVRKIAEVIGLADCPPRKQTLSPYITNKPRSKVNTRKLHMSDLLPFERSLEAERVLLSSRSRGKDQKIQVKSRRKGSVKDVFLNVLRPEENPLICAQTKKAIMLSDLARAKKQARDRQQMRQAVWQKQRRSQILRNISHKISEHKKAKVQNITQIPWYSEYRANGTQRPKSSSEEKLAVSLDLSKFRLIRKNEGITLKSRELSQERKTQTAMGNKRVNLFFNDNNRFQFDSFNIGSQSQF